MLNQAAIGSLFQILQFPRCIQDLISVAVLFQAVSADCFLFKHKSHCLSPNCCVCLYLDYAIYLVMHIQDWCLCLNEYLNVISSFLINFSNLSTYVINMLFCLVAHDSICSCTNASELCFSLVKVHIVFSQSATQQCKRSILSRENWSWREKYLLVMHTNAALAL